MSHAEHRDVLQQTIEQLQAGAQEPLRLELLNGQERSLNYADACITLDLVIAKAELRGLQPCHLAWRSIAAAISLLAAMDRPRLEARARCGFSHREFYWALECDMYGISTGGVTGSRRFARCLPCAIGKPGKCGASSAAWFCRRRLGMLNTCELPPSEKGHAIRMHGVTLMPSRSQGHELARGLGEDGMLQPPSRKTVGPPPGPEDDGLLSLFDRKTWSGPAPQPDERDAARSSGMGGFLATCDTAAADGRHALLLNNISGSGTGGAEKKPETFVSQARQLLETLEGSTAEEQWKEITFACTKRYVGSLKRLAGKESSKRKAQEAALTAAGHASKPLRRVDLQTTQLKRWPDYDFIMGLPESDTVLMEEARAVCACFLNTITIAAIREMQPHCYGLPPWHQHPDLANPGRYLGRQRPFPHNAPPVQHLGKGSRAAVTIPAVKTEGSLERHPQRHQLARSCPRGRRSVGRGAAGVTLLPGRSAPLNADTTQAAIAAVEAGDPLPGWQMPHSFTCPQTAPLTAADSGDLAGESPPSLAEFFSNASQDQIIDLVTSDLLPPGHRSELLRPDYDTDHRSDHVTHHRSEQGASARTLAAFSLSSPSASDCLAVIPTAAPQLEPPVSTRSGGESVDDDKGTPDYMSAHGHLSRPASNGPEGPAASAASDDVVRLLYGHVDCMAPLFTAGHPCSNPMSYASGGSQLHSSGNGGFDRLGHLQQQQQLRQTVGTLQNPRNSRHHSLPCPINQGPQQQQPPSHYADDSWHQEPSSPTGLTSGVYLPQFPPQPNSQYGDISKHQSLTCQTGQTPPLVVPSYPGSHTDLADGSALSWEVCPPLMPRVPKHWQQQQRQQQAGGQQHAGEQQNESRQLTYGQWQDLSGSPDLPSKQQTKPLAPCMAAATTTSPQLQEAISPWSPAAVEQSEILAHWGGPVDSSALRQHHRLPSDPSGQEQPPHPLISKSSSPQEMSQAESLLLLLPRPSQQSLDNSSANEKSQDWSRSQLSSLPSQQQLRPEGDRHLKVCVQGGRQQLLGQQARELQGRSKRGRTFAHDLQSFLGPPPRHPSGRQAVDQQQRCASGASAAEQLALLPTAEEDDFHRVWNFISKSPSNINQSRHSSLSLSSRSNVTPSSEFDVSSLLQTELPHTSSSNQLLTWKLPPADVSDHMLTSSSAAGDSAPRPLHLSGFGDGTAGTAGIATGISDHMAHDALRIPESAEISGVSAPLVATGASGAAAEGAAASGCQSGGSMSMPPLLCATLSDLSFNLDEAWWSDICSSEGVSAAAAAAAFLPPTVEAGSGLPRSGEGMLAFTHNLHRLSSGFSDWRRLEPPLKKQQ